MATKRKAASGPIATRDAADLPLHFQEPVDAAELFSERDVQIAELLVRGYRHDSAKLAKFRLESCIFDTVAIPQAAIQSAQWRDVRFSRCDLANVEIRALKATRVEFLECRMTGLRIAEAELQSLLVSGGDQRYAQFRFANFQTSEFEGCDLQEADFYGADLRGCIFRRCNLQNVEMSKAKLTGTDFRGSIVDGLRLSAEDLAGAVVDAAQALAFAPLLGIRIL